MHIHAICCISGIIFYFLNTVYFFSLNIFLYLIRLFLQLIVMKLNLHYWYISIALTNMIHHHFISAGLTIIIMHEKFCLNLYFISNQDWMSVLKLHSVCNKGAGLADSMQPQYLQRNMMLCCHCIWLLTERKWDK